MKKWALVFLVGSLVLACGLFGEIPEEKIAVVPDEPAGFSVDIRVDRGNGSSYSPGEFVSIFFSVTQDAYVVVYDVSPDGKVTILFPNQYDPDNFVLANQEIRIPRVGYKLMIENALGKEYLQIVACDNQFVAYEDWSQQFTHQVYPPVSGDAMSYFAEFKEKIAVIPDGPQPKWASKIIFFYVQ
ncbi:MAG TPA: DUF4384 domain-containing protein [Thermotogota bacterium]|nr:DUF4384 domain-containing protein [Thermotogota bacterium]HRW93857.1 DUF4384 domain-containing protein [Thermotogota bacterium]